MQSTRGFAPSAFIFFVAAILATPAYAAESADTSRILIRAGHLLDVRTGNRAADQTIVVSGDRIVAIAPSARTPAGPTDREIDLSSSWVLPGLIDVHTHLTYTGDFDPYHQLARTEARAALIGAQNAKVTLEAGFTSVRNVGAQFFADVAVRDEIDAGHLPGPHMQVSGPEIGITGGPGDENLLPVRYHLSSEGVADGVPAVQAKVRHTIKYGADLIKVYATGGVLSKGDDPQASQYSREELTALVADAHRLGRKVAAHAHGAQGILWAAEAGVDSIEHGSYMDDAGIAAMKKHGTYLVPTTYLIDWLRESGNLPEIYRKKMDDVGSVMKGSVKKAIEAGVKVALGTDAAVYPHGLNAHELDVYVNQLGMKPLAAIQAATMNAADLMGWSDRTGSLEAGKWADIIAVDADPLNDVRVLQDVAFVMKAGTVYKERHVRKP